MHRKIIHSDLNNFYASVECLKNPWLRSAPLAVAGDSEKRKGIILAKNIPAAAFGIKTGEPIWKARQKCPDLITVPPSFDDYIKISRRVRKIYEEYSGRVEAFGIDECWLDISDITKDFEQAKLIADDIRKRIQNEIGITASCGVSFNKVFAKLASDIKKPDATTVIRPNNYKDIVWQLPADAMLFVGRSTKNAFSRLNIHTIGDIANTDVKSLEFIFGKNGIKMWNNANGVDEDAVIYADISYEVKSVGNSVTTAHDLVCDDDVKIVLFSLCETVSARMRKMGIICNTVQLYVKDCELNSYQRQTKLNIPNRTVLSLFDNTYDMYLTHHTSGKPIRALGVRVSELSPDDDEQLSIDPETIKLYKCERLDLAADSIRERFGESAIKRGILLTDSLLSLPILEEKCSFSKI